MVVTGRESSRTTITAYRTFKPMCPDCKQPLVIYELEGVEIDHCLSCSGTWLDGGELELLMEFSGLAPGGLTRALVEARSEGKSTRCCPRCGRHLGVVHVGGERPVEIDRCPVGHGLWLDKGETLSLIASFDESKAEEGVVAHFFANLYHDEFKSTAESNEGVTP